MEDQNIKKKSYDQARVRTHVNIRTAFQRWRELKEREWLESDAEAALFLLDRRVAEISKYVLVLSNINMVWQKSLSSL